MRAPPDVPTVKLRPFRSGCVGPLRIPGFGFIFSFPFCALLPLRLRLFLTFKSMFRRFKKNALFPEPYVPHCPAIDSVCRRRAGVLEAGVDVVQLA